MLILFIVVDTNVKEKLKYRKVFSLIADDGKAMTTHAMQQGILQNYHL